MRFVGSYVSCLMLFSLIIILPTEELAVYCMLVHQLFRDQVKKWFQSNSTGDWHAGGMLVESALFVLDLLCFHCVFSIKIAITNIWRDKGSPVLIQTLV